MEDTINVENQIVDNNNYSLENCEYKEDKWNYGIDILRMISMAMICILHTLNQGGVLSHCNQNGIINWNQYYMSWILEIATFGCVDIYALISGYVGSSSKFRISKILYTWLEIALYCIGITLFFQIKYPDLIVEGTWRKAFMPIIFNQYWYMSAYIGLMILMPFLNMGLKHLDNKFLLFFSIFMLVVFSFLPIHFKQSVFGLGWGYSLIWLLLCYILGGTIKKIDFFSKIPFYVGLLMYVLMVGLTYLIFRTSKTTQEYVNYNSPTILLSAIGLLICCSKIKINNKVVKYILKLFGEATFAVYLIHVHPLIWAKYIKLYSQTFHMTDNPGVFHLFLMIMLGSMTIYLECTLIDIVRIYLFRLIKVKKWFGYIDKLYDKIPIVN